MARSICRLVVVLLLIGPATGAWALDIVVAPDGSGDAPTIAAAIDSFMWELDGRIILLDGVYTGDGNRDLYTYGLQVAIVSQSGDPTACIIDCQGSEQEPHQFISYIEDG